MVCPTTAKGHCSASSLLHVSDYEAEIGRLVYLQVLCKTVDYLATEVVGRRTLKDAGRKVYSLTRDPKE